MKQQLQKLAQKVDALSLRERVIVFVTIAVGLIFLINSFVLDPLFAKQKQLANQIQQMQARTNEMQLAIQQKIKAREIDPDAVDRARLQALNQQFMQAHSSVIDMQKGLVAPERMAVLLEDILKRNGKLRLTSLKTLPVSDVSETAAEADKTAANRSAATVAPASAEARKETGEAASSSGRIYKHGIEITMHGSYPDMIDYMQELEGMPWRIFWGKAKLDVDQYPNATLTLTLFTLSLDKKWLNI